jgi:hypothetical protein
MGNHLTVHAKGSIQTSIGEVAGQGKIASVTNARKSCRDWPAVGLDDESPDAGRFASAKTKRQSATPEQQRENERYEQRN